MVLFFFVCQEEAITEMTLEEKAKVVRRKILDISNSCKLPHVAPALSIVEILVALYEAVLNENDKFILSKGHACLSLYAILRQHGFNPTLSGHPDIQRDQGIECTTGSLGHGLPMGTGMALARKLKNENGNIYVLISDGECQEGTTWESMLISSHHELDNLTIIVDHNKMQTLGKVEDILSLGDLKRKLDAFGCLAMDVDGHCIPEIVSALKKKPSGSPKALIANTTKGKGISFMENKAEWHSRLLNTKELEIAIEELK